MPKSLTVLAIRHRPLQPGCHLTLQCTMDRLLQFSLCYPGLPVIFHVCTHPSLSCVSLNFTLCPSWPLLVMSPFCQPYCGVWCSTCLSCFPFQFKFSPHLFSPIRIARACPLFFHIPNPMCLVPVLCTCPSPGCTSCAWSACVGVGYCHALTVCPVAFLSSPV